jgi:hypothetical protein
MTDNIPESRLRRVLAEHDRYLTSMMNADARGADQSDYLNASFDLHSRLTEAGFGDLNEQQRMHAAALIPNHDLISDANTSAVAEPATAAWAGIA